MLTATVAIAVIQCNLCRDTLILSAKCTLPHRPIISAQQFCFHSMVYFFFLSI